MEKVFEIKNLKKYFPLEGKSVLKAVDDVSLDIYKGEVLSLVGESGSGKTTFGRTICRLYEKTFGNISLFGKPIEKYSKKEFTKNVQMIFQDPQASLNPRMTVGDIIAEGMDIHKLYKNKSERQEKIYSLLELVGLSREHANRFPHEFSGGQRQRIGIARALAVQPEVLLMDEPTSALDPISTGKIEDLVRVLKEKYTIIMVTHNMQQAIRISDDTAFFLLGRIIEVGKTDDIFSNPRDKRTEDYITGRFG